MLMLQMLGIISR